MDVQNDIIKPGSVQNKVLVVVLRIRLNLAKNTTRLSIGTSGGGYVFTTPWAPQPVQLQLPRYLITESVVDAIHLNWWVANFQRKFESAGW